MADTTNYGWHKPTVNGDGDAWGTKVNAALDAADASLKTVSTADLAAAAAAQTTANAACVKANNLSDVSDASAARGHLGIGSMATRNVTISTSDPSGTPADGDIWIKYTP